MSDVLVFVEGKDEVAVFHAIVERQLRSVAASIEFKAPTRENFEGTGADRSLDSFESSLDETEPLAKVVAIVLDANENPASTWQRVRARLVRKGMENAPAEYPPEGFIGVNAISKGVGCWLMPGGSTRGSLEGLLWQSTQNPQQPSLQRQAGEYVENIDPKLYASESEPTNAVQKAKLAAWLAVQERPGLLSGHAVRRNVIPPDAPCFEPFLHWLSRLCEQASVNSVTRDV
jgi:hypothetical protein